MENAFVVAANSLGEEKFNEVVEAFMDAIEISVQVSAEKSYVPQIGKDGVVFSKHTDLYETDDIVGISVRVNDERIAYLVEDLDESVKNEILLELFSFYQSLDYDIDVFKEAALERANAFDFMQYEA